MMFWSGRRTCLTPWRANTSTRRTSDASWACRSSSEKGYSASVQRRQAEPIFRPSSIDAQPRRTTGKGRLTRMSPMMRCTGVVDRRCSHGRTTNSRHTSANENSADNNDSARMIAATAAGGRAQEIATLVRTAMLTVRAMSSGTSDLQRRPAKINLLHSAISTRCVLDEASFQRSAFTLASRRP
jgi:hypothetical protein